MTPPHILHSFRVWTATRRSRIPSLIAAACLAGAGLLALSQAESRARPDGGGSAVSLDREELQSLERRQFELIDKVDRILARLPEEP